MSTIVSLHAHPDDEAIVAGGTLARAADDGHRVVIVFATRGEVGEVPEGLLTAGEQLGDRREREARTAGGILGAARVEFLGYLDSGMMGEPTNEHPACFWQADVDQAARRLAAILIDENADVLTAYDEIGGYGHPDHIQVHRVGTRAANLASTAEFFQVTSNRDYYRTLISGWGDSADQELQDIDETELGMPEDVITTFVDVSDYLDVKRRAMAAHASQVAETSFFLNQPPDRFAALWSTEWLIRRGAPAGARERWLFPEEES